MNFTRNKSVRFKDRSSQGSFSSERHFSAEDGQYPRKTRKTLSSVLRSMQGEFENGSERIKSEGKLLNFHPPSNQSSKELGSRKKILDPQGPFLLKWNKIFVLSCVIAVSLDPLFFYIPVLDGEKKCLDVDENMAIIASVLRSFTDIFYVLHIIFQFRTGFVAPSSRVFGRGELIEDQSAIVKKYLASYFIIDILSVLPLPQVALVFIIPKMKGPVPLVTKEALKFVILCQYVPRLIRIYPLYVEVTRTSGILTETAWAGAAFNLLLYVIAGHIVGACWYLLSIERNFKCWRDACRRSDHSCKEILYCEKLQHPGNGFLNASHEIGFLNASHEIGVLNASHQIGFLNASCPLIEADGNSTIFTLVFFLMLFSLVWWNLEIFRGNYLTAFGGVYEVLETAQVHCSLGQNLQTSTFIGEIFFAVFISIFGLVLFSLLIGNMQKYLQSTTVRIEQMRVKRQDAEHWMSHRMLPEVLRERIRQYEQYQWQETRGVEEETLVGNLPKDLRRDIKRHLCLDLLMRVPMFETMDEQLLDAMCDRLKPVLYIEKSFITREGDPVDEMLFIMRGNLVTMTTYGGKTGFFNSAYLNAGDFCGDELLTWALDPNSSSNLPSSTRTVRALTEVEAFALMANDLKFVASQFRRLHSKKLQHTFRFYSQQWRTWAACFIQSAWRRYCRRKLENSLREEEDRLQYALAKETGTSSPSLGATIYASKFAVNLLRTVRRKGARNARVPQKLLLPQKPAEPDFTA